MAFDSFFTCMYWSPLCYRLKWDPLAFQSSVSVQLVPVLCIADSSHLCIPRLSASSPQIKEVSAWVAMLWLVNALKAVNWGKLWAQLICFLSLRYDSSYCLIFTVLKIIVSYNFSSIFSCFGQEGKFSSRHFIFAGSTSLSVSLLVGESCSQFKWTNNMQLDRWNVASWDFTTSVKWNGRHHLFIWTSNYNNERRTSLVAQLLRIRLPMHGTWVWSLVW